MQSTRARSLRAILFAVVIGAAGASPAFAAEDSATVTESLTVEAYIALTGVPASIDYGLNVGGDVAVGDLFELAVETNNATGSTVSVAATDLVAGGATIPKANRAFITQPFASACSWDNVSHINECFVPSGGAYVENGGGRMTIGTSSTAGEGGERELYVRPEVTVPSDASAGVYTGSFTVYATTNP